MPNKPVTLITGAAGNIGRKLRDHLAERFELRLLDMNDSSDGRIEKVDLATVSVQTLAEKFTGLDVIVHRAADPNETKTWNELLAPNMDAQANFFAAATMAKVPRVIFASSNHVMGGYSEEKRKVPHWLTTDLEPKPGTKRKLLAGKPYDSTAYAAMKLCAERMGKTYAETTGGVCIAVRIGWVNREGKNRPEDIHPKAEPWFKKMWLSTRDMCQLVELAATVDKPPGTFIVLNGMSNNEDMAWDIEQTKKELGYLPQDGLRSVHY